MRLQRASQIIVGEIENERDVSAVVDKFPGMTSGDSRINISSLLMKLIPIWNRSPRESIKIVSNVSLKTSRYLRRSNELNSSGSPQFFVTLPRYFVHLEKFFVFPLHHLSLCRRNAKLPRN